MKKIKQSVHLPSSEELARVRAQEIRKLREEIVAATENLANLEQAQLEFMRKSALTNFEGFKLVETKGRVAFHEKSGKELSSAKSLLLGRIDEAYIKRSIDLDLLWADKSNSVVVESLASVGLTLTQNPPTFTLRITA